MSETFVFFLCHKKLLHFTVSNLVAYIILLLKSNVVKSANLRIKCNFYKQIAILRRQYHIILTASWEKIYSVLGSVASRLRPTPSI